MNIKVICIGDELLCGNTLNTNLLYAGEQLACAGYRVAEEICVPDTEQDILGALQQCAGTEVVLLIGGLGPTRDDMTRPTVAKFLGRPLRFHPEIRDGIAEYLGARGKKMPAASLEVQAEVPEGAEALPNRNGTAPGIAMEGRGTLWFLMPGPPREMHPMFDQEVLPRIRVRFPSEWAELAMHVIGIGESIVEERVQKALGKMQESVHIAYCIKDDNVEIRLGMPTGKGEIPALLQEAKDAVRKEFGLAMLPEDCADATEYLAKLLLARKYAVATAESCTGGGIAARFTELPGASRWFHGAFVTYTNEWKHRFLGVAEATLAAHGAVSTETVAEMLDGVLQKTEADCAIAVSGIAGPDGGTPDKPVGTVVIGVADRRGKEIQVCHFHGKRDTVRFRTATTAIVRLIQRLCGIPAPSRE